MLFMFTSDNYDIYIKWKSGEMEVSLTALMRYGSWFAKAKKLLEMSIESDNNFNTKNTEVWLKFFRYFADREISPANAKKLQELNSIFNKHKRKAKVLF